MPGPAPARRSRLIALGLSVGALVGLVTAMVATEHPAAPAPAVGTPAAPSTTAGPAAAGAATPATPGRIRQTITSAS